MARKRAPGGGRKPENGEAGPKTETILTRVHPDLKRRIKLAAGGKSLSSETVKLLEEGLAAREGAQRDKPVRAICYVVAEAANACRAFRDKDGTPMFELTDPFVFRAFKITIAQLLDLIEPQGEPQSIVDRVGKDTFRHTPPSIVDGYRTPEARAKAAIEFIWTKLTRPTTNDELELARNWEPYGKLIERMHYAMSDARRDLDIKSGGTK
jgi:hypothetical protein